MHPDTATIEQAGQAILEGKVIAYPTEAVWGLGCNPFDEQAVTRLLQLKNRPVEKGLILVAASFEQIEPYLADALGKEAREQLCKLAGVPTTWLVPFKQQSIPSWITGEHSRLAIRISQHPVIQALCHYVGMPIVSTSANLPACLPATHVAEVVHFFGDDAVIICEGEVGDAAQPSMIKDLLTGAIIRE